MSKIITVSQSLQDTRGQPQITEFPWHIIIFRTRTFYEFPVVHISTSNEPQNVHTCACYVIHIYDSFSNNIVVNNTHLIQVLRIAK
jgi:hypothetical protein